MGREELEARLLRIARGPVREPAPGETRTLRLLDRRDRPMQAAPTPVVVTVSAACPTCGMARGEPKDMTVLDHCSETEHVLSRWSNPCGHLDLHEDVIAEADAYRLQRTA